MKIAIIGAGALGCFFGAKLHEAGEDVWLVHYRDEYVEQLQSDGIRIESDISGFTHSTVPVTTDAIDVGCADLVLVFVKAHNTETALKQHGACIGSETRLLSLQNGLQHYDLLRGVAKKRAFGGYTRQAVTRTSPGALHHVKNGPSVFGGEDQEVARSIGKVLEDADLPCQIVTNPEKHIWEKQLISLAIKPIAGVTRLRNDELDRSEFLSIMENLVQEAVTVADSRGISLSTEESMEAVRSACQSAHHSSMLQDLKSGQETEIGEINGVIVSYADEHDIDVPYNRMATELIRGIQRNFESKE